MGDYKFPRNFFFGAATSAHQVEGGNRNDWSEWERANSARLAADAQKRFADEVKQLNGGNFTVLPEAAFRAENYISGIACDHYNRFREDFDIAKSLGHNTHRFSIEWSRIEPEEGKFDEREIEHYREVVKALRERGIEPFVTLWHWTLPLWIRNQGGWENEKTIADFLSYAEKIVDELGQEITFWIPINEPSVYVGHAYVIGVFPPEVVSYRRANRVMKNLITAHKKTYQLIHQKLGGRARVGSAHNLHYHVPYRRSSPLDILAMKILDYIRDLRPLTANIGYQDFIGMNYYYRDHVKFALWGGRFGMIDIRNPNVSVSDMGWDIAPEGIYHALKKLKKYNLPIYITENGIADAKDKKRAKFIEDHLRWIAKALKEGIDVRGYFYWSLLDNFEWDKGFWPRFGLVEIDYKTLERKIRPSAWAYKQIIENAQKY